MSNLYNYTIYLYWVILIALNLVFLKNYNKIFKKLNFFDYPDNIRKIHNTPVSLAGGLLIYVNFLFILSSVFILGDQTLNDFYIFSLKNFFIFLFSVSLIFFVGLYDDKFTLSPFTRLLVITFSIYLILKTDDTLLLKELLFSFSNLSLQINSLAFPFTLLCFISLILALNMFDGINLQSGIFYFLFFSFVVVITKNISILLLLISIIIFLYLNFKNKVFLGDSGSYFLSVIVAFFSIKLYKYHSAIFSDHVLIFLFLPILDIIRVTILRLLNGKKIFNPDKTHFHHLLLKKYNYNYTILIMSLFFLIPYIGFFFKINSIITLIIISFSYLYFLKTK